MTTALAAASGAFSAAASGLSLAQANAAMGAGVPRTGTRTASNTMGYELYDRPITTGATGAITYTSTWTGANAAGSGGLIVLHETPVKGESGGYNPTGGTATGPFPLPIGLATGDGELMLIVSAGNNPAFTSGGHAGWSVLATGNIGSGGWMLVKRDGGKQSGDGASVTFTFTTTIAVSYSCLGFDGTVYDPDTFVMSAPNVRSTNVAVTTADPTPNLGLGLLVLSAEKASAHTGVPDPPVVAPATACNCPGTPAHRPAPSSYIGIYTAAAAPAHGHLHDRLTQRRGVPGRPLACPCGRPSGNQAARGHVWRRGECATGAARGHPGRRGNRTTYGSLT